MNNKNKLFYLLIAEMGLLVITGLLDFVFITEMGVQSQMMEEIFDIFKTVIINTMTFYFVFSSKEA